MWWQQPTGSEAEEDINAGGSQKKSGEDGAGAPGSTYLTFQD